MATVVHASDAGVEKEITPFPGELLQLGESDDGGIYAVGLRRDEQSGSDRGIMFTRAVD